MSSSRTFFGVLGLALLAVVHVASAQFATFGPDSAVQLASLDQEIATALAAIERTEARKHRVEAEISGLGERRAAAQGRLKSHTRSLYRMSKAGMLPLAGGLQALLRHSSRVERLKRMVESDARALSSLRTRGTALRAETGELAATLERTRAELAALSGRKSSLEQEQRRASQFDQVFTNPGAAQARDYGFSNGSFRIVDDGQPTHRFDDLRGRLPMPVRSSANVQRAVRDGAEGLEFMGASGAPARAVAAGRVAFADQYPSYGRLVILDHGDGYFTVYGGLAGIAVRAGDTASAGARLGDAGSALFFEVRRGTRTLDASSWLGL